MTTTPNALAELDDIADVLESHGATGSADRAYYIRSKATAPVEAARPFDRGPAMDGLSADFPCRIVLPASDYRALSTALRDCGH
jgi:hypothetical protein